MNDAEFLRNCAANVRERKRGGELGGLDEERADRLTAIADRLQDGVIVPREPTEAMLIAGGNRCGSAHNLPCDDVTARGVYRAMLTASEAK